MARNKNLMPNWVLAKSEACGWRTWGVSMPGARFYFVNDEATIRYVLSERFDDFEKGALFQDTFEELLHEGIFAVDGEPWQRERRIASHLFSARLLREMNAVFASKAQELARRLLQRSDGVDLQQEFCRFTFAAFAQVAFGFDIERDAASADRFALAFDTCQQLCSQRFFLPPPVWKLQRLLGVGDEAALAAAARQLTSYIDGIVAERLPRTIAAIEELLGKHSADELELHHESDLLSLFVLYAYQHEQPQLLTSRYIAQTVVNFLLAGRDTTACLLTHLHKYLAQHPAHYDRFVAECRQASHDGQQLELVCKAGRAPFVNACILETLRLAPPVPVDSKIVRVAAATLPNGVAVERGDIVSYPAIAIGRSPRTFADAHVFDPERFLPAPDKPVNKNPPYLRSECAVVSDYQMPVFNAGHRICLGKVMAQNEAKLVAASLALAGIRFESLRQGPEHYRVPVMMLFGGLPVKVHHHP